MTVNYAGSAPGPTAGPAGEVPAVQLVRSFEGWWTTPLGIEHRLSPYVLGLSGEHHVSWAIYPDHVCYRRNPVPAMFAMNVTGIYVPRESGRELQFAIKKASVDGLIAFSNATHMQAVHVVVPVHPEQARVIKPFQTESWAMDDYGNYRVDASHYPLLSDWIQHPEPYVGGALIPLQPVPPALPPAVTAAALLN
jgi:hypothetical protein